jgi:hypothetical protein
MSVHAIYRLSGYLAVVTGLLSALCIFRKEYLFYGIPLAILGFLFSGLNIILNAKYEYEGEKYPRGYWGLFLSSLPVVFFLLLMKRHGQ